MYALEIVELDRKEYDYFELNYSYRTKEYYKVSSISTKEKMGVEFERCSFDEERLYENTDTLFQEYWNNPRAFGVRDDDGSIIAYLEFDTEEWNNRLVMTQLLVKNECRGKGVGRMLVDFVKDFAAREDYRIITLETQNTNIPAIDFYFRMGFRFCGSNIFFYSNDDIGENEVMLEMAITL